MGMTKKKPTYEQALALQKAQAAAATTRRNRAERPRVSDAEFERATRLRHRRARVWAAWSDGLLSASEFERLQREVYEEATR